MARQTILCNDLDPPVVEAVHPPVALQLDDGLLLPVAAGQPEVVLAGDEAEARVGGVAAAGGRRRVGGEKR